MVQRNLLEKALSGNPPNLETVFGAARERLAHLPPWPDVLVERVARAIYTADSGHLDWWDLLSPDRRSHYRLQASAALTVVADA